MDKEVADSLVQERERKKAREEVESHDRAESDNSSGSENVPLKGTAKKAIKPELKKRYYFRGNPYKKAGEPSVIEIT